MKLATTFLLSAALVAAQVTVPDGTKIRVRLDQMLSSGTADQGQTVELSVTEPVKIDGQVVIPEGSRVTGTVTEAQEKRHMGRAGKLDFSIDRVRAADGEWIPLRYTVTKKSGGSHAVSTGVLTAGAAVLFWPAAPAFLLIKGKDVTLNKGMVFDTFTDQDHTIGAGAGGSSIAAKGFSGAAGTSSVTIGSNITGVDIEVDGAYVGSTPATLPLSAGTHQITVKSGSAVWQRSLLVNAGGTVNVNAQLEQMQTASRRTRQ
jgi:PEGA domain